MITREPPNLAPSEEPLQYCRFSQFCLDCEDSLLILSMA
jgi:hypothetical protein